MIDTIMATTTDFFNTTGKRIGIMRKQRGFSQTELANALQVAPSYVSQMESDRREPSLKVFVGLVEQLQTTADYLLMLSDDPEKSSSQAVERYISPEADSADVTAANAWLRRHVRIWVAYHKVVAIEWL